MKKKTYFIFIFIIVILFCLPFTTIAEERNFPAGSLIIPMDSFYQKDDDGGILEAYGLVFYLLSHKSLNEHFDLENDITVYWIIDDQKVNINDTDFAIMDATATGDVASVYDHAGGDSALPAFNSGDNSKKMAYSGAPFVIDANDAEAAKTVINAAGWIAVDIHVATVPFAAPVYREMIGTPPRIALMNDSEEDSGNAQILESYLRLAGICSDVFDTVTPNDIRDNILQEQGYDFLWTPHWTGYEKYTADADGNSVPDVEDIVIKIREFVENGKGVLAECASIEVFEHSQNGRFLSTKGFGHNGGTDDPATIIYNDVVSPNPQGGDFAFVPEGGHIHNWRAFEFGDDYKFADRPDETPAGDPEVTSGNPSVYADTVTRFISDNTGWDYYVGGYAYGDTNNGYVVYLGGHKYAECEESVIVPTYEANVHEVLFGFDKDFNAEDFTIDVGYDSGSNSSITFGIDDLTAKSGNPLEIDLSTAKKEKNKEGGVLNNVTFRNNGTSWMTINSINVSWTGGDAAQKLQKVEDLDTDIKYLDKGTLSSPAVVPIVGLGFTLDIVPGSDKTITSCTDNGDCTWKNIAGVRFVLNTLFNIKFQIKSYEYVRSAPVVQHPYIYQGSFEYPSYYGHFRRHDVERNKELEQTAEWDTGDHINDALGGNSYSSARQVFTSRQDDDGNWLKIPFDADHVDLLNVPLNITPDDGDNNDEIKVINRLRGKDEEGEEITNKLGGIMHSAPVIVTQNSRTGSIGSNRAETAYVGDVYGMIHAIDISTGHEKWAFIPGNLLEKLQNQRIDPNAVQDFAAVDGSPTARDIYYDHDNNPDTEEVWRTILICSEGMGGSNIFALDVTDPDNFSVLWEITDPPDPIPDGYEEAPGGMGHSFRVSIGRVKSPVYESNVFSHYEKKWMVFTATGFLDYNPHGGINVFAFDLKTGERVWYFSSEYSDSINDIPGAITLYDTSGDSFVDRVFVGDMNGRLWELNALDGVNPHGTDQKDENDADYGKQIPLWNAGVGNPISVSPAVIRYNPLVVIFGTGGADWAANDKSYSVYAVNASDLKTGVDKTYDAGAGTLLWEVTLDVGEKVWSSPTIASGTIYIATATGTMESSDPVKDFAGTGRLLAINLAPDDSGNAQLEWSIDDIGKARGSLFVERQHIYLTTNNRTIKQIGDGDFSEGNVNMTVLKSWKLK